MPVPRLYEAFSEPREQWVHVLATLLQLGGAETRAALVAELLGDPIDGTDQMLVSERRVVGTGADAVTLRHHVAQRRRVGHRDHFGLRV